MTDQPEISRVTRSKKQAIAAYDQLSESSEWPLTVMGLNKLNPEAGKIILEIGFGTGNALLVLAEVVGDSGKVVGIDISRDMFEVTREKNCPYRSVPARKSSTRGCYRLALSRQLLRCDF